MDRKVLRVTLTMLGVSLAVFATWLTLDDGWDVYAALLMVFVSGCISMWLDSGGRR